MPINKRQRGFTLVETLVYAAGLVILLGAMTGFLYYMYDWYRTVTIAPRNDRVGVVLVDRIARDIRASASINVASSVFSTTSGAISVTSTATPVATTTTITLSNGRITYKINSGSVQYLSPPDVTVSSLYMTQITTAISTAVKIDVELSYSTRAGIQKRTYTGLAILRQSYH